MIHSRRGRALALAFPLALLGSLVGALVVAAVRADAPAETLEFGRFGRVALYREREHPSHVVLFVSGDGGWNLGVVDMARALASQDALVIGIDITHYLRELGRAKEECHYPAADFEALSQFVQHRLGFPRYTTPLLVGYSSGASLVYAALAQAPSNTFRGAISLGFCPDLALSGALCRGSGPGSEAAPGGHGLRLLPAPRLERPWVVLQGTQDQVCAPAGVQSFAKRVGAARVVSLPRVGHGFSVQKNWMPQLRDAFAGLAGETPPGAAAGPAAPEVADLPLVELPAAGPAKGDLMAVMVSGDGGWAGIDREVARSLASHGVPVVGLDSLQFFWRPKTPDLAGDALARILRHFLATFRRRRAILVGYSRGADVLPFMASRLPRDLAQRVALIALLGPGARTTFEFHVSEWLGGSSGADEQPVLPEVEKLRGRRILCVYGADETDSLCSQLREGLAVLDRRPGGHHFGGDYEAIARRILEEAASTEVSR
jgi:type IV secretory pathway VirJ component